jgi:hypothetical protein
MFQTKLILNLCKSFDEPDCILKTSARWSQQRQKNINLIQIQVKLNKSLLKHWKGYEFLLNHKQLIQNK